MQQKNDFLSVAKLRVFNFLLDSSAVTFISTESVKVLLDDYSRNYSINISWSQAQCSLRYKIQITNESGGIIIKDVPPEETFFAYTVSTVGCYNFSVNNVDYFGMDVNNPISTRVCVGREYYYYL